MHLHSAQKSTAHTLCTVLKHSQQKRHTLPSYAPPFGLQFAESFMADTNFFISLDPHLLKHLCLVLIYILANVTPVEQAAC